MARFPAMMSTALPPSKLTGAKGFAGQDHCSRVLRCEAPTRRRTLETV